MSQKQQEKKMTLRTLIQRAVGYITGKEPPTPREARKDMYKGLEVQGEATSFTMARADDLYERLEAEIANNEALQREAEAFVRDGDLQAAERCVTLRVQSDEKIVQLKKKYEETQRQAEADVAQFRKNDHELKARAEALPEMEERQHIVAMGERIQKKLEGFSMDSPKRAFDQAAHELRIRERQVTNRQLLASDPNAELDLRIRQAVGERKIAEAMQQLRQKVAAEGDAIEGEVVKAPQLDQAVEAKKLLEAPRYSGLGITSGVGSRRQPAMVRQITTGGEER